MAITILIDQEGEREKKKKMADVLIDLMLNVFDRSIMIMGPFLLVGGSFLVCVVGFIFFNTPFLSLETNSPVTVAIADLIGVWLWFNVLFNWFMCWRTSPGEPPRDPTKIQQSQNSSTSLCQKCDAFKPARAHHCHVCQRCVLAMDHHCPWMANCIGFYNYRYFVLTLVYLTVGCMFCVLISSYQFSIVTKLMMGDGSSEIPKYVFFVFFLCSTAGCAVGLLLVWHLYLIFSGQTTIEFYQRRSTPNSRGRRSRLAWYKLAFFHPPLEANDYDLGPAQNWARVFGESSNPFSWLLPSLRPPPGDGIAWKSCRSLVSLV